MLVVDYKSDGVGPGEDIESLVERDYAVQRLIYALAVLRTGAQEVRGRALVPAAARGVGAAPATRPPSAAPLEAELAVRLRDARSGAFEVSPRPHRGLCLTCPGRSGLCSWGDRVHAAGGSGWGSAPPRPPRNRAAPVPLRLPLR